MIKVGIIGGTGYTGGELLRVLYNHPEAEISVVTSRSNENKKVSDVHKYLRNIVDLTFTKTDPRSVSECDVVFTAVPHTKAMEIVPRLLDSGIKVIDLSADYRLDFEIYERVYGVKHKDKGRSAVYGLSELYREEIRNSSLVANPGCFPTGAILSAYPIVSKGYVEQIIFDSKTGISGAGASPTDNSHYPNMAENVIPYKLTAHRHLEEMRSILKGVRVSFTPHIVPVIRGILTTAHILLKKTSRLEEIIELYKKYYKKDPFIRVFSDIPSLSYVRGANFCDIGGFALEVENDRLVVVSAIDNLVKGAAGQAVQNMNIMFGLNEKTGLFYPGISP
ncbi:MAG: N-acetyl-gamma-glutamyl-phosphate reductase [Candidatus Methanoliparum thermophilum]|uniref:N-acetyl-gamma-glutamyl-phosphate reductase n=1 Tax=Methanoliparum thermophilum TaxID=2491083 RepID=A0A520KT69_METT2|nr:N-acetyl-gamma-glutamyl-phosphate reductase [Candidatus Methanoliparum sp. LAM-1]RZN65189.1 MAG: N-acetyl-gamma-glutamyl-phosphate reductase [Candidatus Methanoliparum thermophilum]